MTGTGVGVAVASGASGESAITGVGAAVGTGVIPAITCASATFAATFAVLMSFSTLSASVTALAFSSNRMLMRFHVF